MSKYAEIKSHDEYQKAYRKCEEDKAEVGQHLDNNKVLKANVDSLRTIAADLMNMQLDSEAKLVTDCASDLMVLHAHRQARVETLSNDVDLQSEQLTIARERDLDVVPLVDDER